MGRTVRRQSDARRRRDIAEVVGGVVGGLSGDPMHSRASLATITVEAQRSGGVVKLTVQNLGQVSIR